MTEKQYGGASSHAVKDISTSTAKKERVSLQSRRLRSEDAHSEARSTTAREERDIVNKESKIKDLDLYLKAGEIAKQIKIYAKSIIKPEISLLEIADNIESKIIELGGFPAFPVNLSKNEIAAHSTPSYNDTDTASGLLKVDIGVHIDGCVADTALSIDLENSQENKKLIDCAELCLKNALEVAKFNVELKNIGEQIEKTAQSYNLQPIINLSGHSITKYNLHAGVTIPNYNNSSKQILGEGVFAIEPFTTTGNGKVIDGKPSGIYIIEGDYPVRDNFAREVLNYIVETYQSLPFCSRWLVKKFGTRALIALKRLEDAKILHHYPQLIEISRNKVAQAEHTILITENSKTITT